MKLQNWWQVTTLALVLSVLCSPYALAEECVQGFACGGGQVNIQKLPNGAGFGVGGGSYFTHVVNPAFSGARAGFFIPEIRSPGTWDGSTLTWKADASARAQTISRLCFTDGQERNFFSVDVPLQKYSSSISGNFIVSVLSKSSPVFNNHSIVKNGNAKLVSVQFFLRSSSRTTTAFFGDLNVDTTPGNFEAGDIVYANAGCSALECSKFTVKKNSLKSGIQLRKQGDSY